MSEAASEGGPSRARSAAKSGGGAPAGGAPPGGAPRHARPFKLRFAAQRQPGRSYVSAVKPLGLPATVTGKFYSARSAEGDLDEEVERRTLRRLQQLFAPPPRGEEAAAAAAAAATTARDYGWWAAPTTRRDPRLYHHLRDSAWLKARLAVLAADDKLKQK